MVFFLRNFNYELSWKVRRDKKGRGMARTYGEKFIETTMHDFKSNIAKYIRILDQGRFEGVVVKRYNEPVGLFVPMRPKPKPKSDDEYFEELMEKLAD